MTSKNLCFKLMREDLKRRIWTVALLMLTFFFCIVIPVFYSGSRPMDEFTDALMWLNNVRDEVWEIVGAENPFIVMTMIVAAIVCGVSGFSYLHAAKKVDFYHSIPVKREQLFLASYLNGILMMAAVYLLNLLIAMIGASTFGVGFGETFSVAMMAFFFHMAFYCLMYTTVVLAMMLTGNVIIALLGTLVFYSYGPLVTALFSGYMSSWFQTFSYTDGLNDKLEFLMVHTSPFGYYMTKIDSYGEESVAAVVLATCLIAALLAVGACLLYRLRPSESAGRAMAFKKTMAPIKILLVMPLALAFSLFFYMLRSSFGWAIFGVLCGALIVHCLMEIIYHFDFRKLFSHKVHLAVCIVAGLLIVCGFRFDWFGYDSYLPKENQVKSASVYLRSLDNWVTYGYVQEPRYEDGYYSWNYQSGEAFIREYMKLEQTAEVIAMAEEGIAYNKNVKNQQWSDYNDYEEYMGFNVEYTLNSGRVVSRIYSAPVSAIEDSLRQIYNSPAYKKGVYPILSQTADETVRANFQQYDKIAGIVEGGASAELLKAYQEDLESLTYETREKELPIGTIQFVTTIMDKALTGRENDSSNGYYYSRDIADRCYYPVYPSFTKTLELLEKNGVTVEHGLSSSNVEKIEIWDYSGGREWSGSYYDEYGYEVKEYGYSAAADGDIHITIVDKAEIDELGPALVYQDYYGMNESAWWTQVMNTDVSVTMEDGRYIRCLLDSEKVPAFLKQRIEQTATES